MTYLVLTKNCCKCHITKPAEDFARRSRTKDGLDSYCRECKSKIAAESYARNSEKIKERVRSYQKNNKAEIKRRKAIYSKKYAVEISERRRLFRKENAEYLNNYSKQYHAKHREERNKRQCAYQKKNRAKANKRNSEYAKRNRPKLNAAWEKRRATQIQATPSWADSEKILSFYKKATNLTKTTGVRHHVDHIVPLVSKIVCGLHCEANLQVLSGYDNASKGNLVWPGMP